MEPGEGGKRHPYIREKGIETFLISAGHHRQVRPCITIWDLSIRIDILYNTLFSREENFAKSEFEIFSREDIFANILFTRKYLPAKISSRENIFSRKYPLAKISSRENILPRKSFAYFVSVASFSLSAAR